MECLLLDLLEVGFGGMARLRAHWVVDWSLLSVVDKVGKAWKRLLMLKMVRLLLVVRVDLVVALVAKRGRSPVIVVVPHGIFVEVFISEFGVIHVILGGMVECACLVEERVEAHDTLLVVSRLLLILLLCRL